MENGTTTDKRNVTYKKYLNDLISEVQKMLYKYKFVKHTKKMSRVTYCRYIPILKLLVR